MTIVAETPGHILGVITGTDGTRLSVTVEGHLVCIGQARLDKDQRTRLLALLIEGERDAAADPEEWVWQ